MLGDMYLRGTTLPSDPVKGQAYLERAVAAGNTAAMVRLGSALVRGKEIPGDPVRGLALLNERAEKNDPGALFALANLSMPGGGLAPDPEATIRNLKAAAEAGNKDALRRLGEIYRDGSGVPRNRQLALRYLQQAVDAGNDNALVSLGIGYLYGTLGPRNPEKAFSYFKAADAKGIKGAMSNMANGAFAQDVPASIRNTVMKRLAKDADAGNVAAARTLIALYRDGRKPMLAASPTKARGLLKKYDALFTASDKEFETLMLDAVAARGVKQYAAIAARYETLSPDMKERFLGSIRGRQDNVYVYILQTKLAEGGFYKGKPTGTLNGATIQAISKFCADRKLTSVCNAGPLDWQSAMAIAGELP